MCRRGDTQGCLGITYYPASHILTHILEDSHLSLLSGPSFIVFSTTSLTFCVSPNFYQQLVRHNLKPQPPHPSLLWHSPSYYACLEVSHTILIEWLTDNTYWDPECSLLAHQSHYQQLLSTHCHILLNVLQLLLHQHPNYFPPVLSLLLLNSTQPITSNYQ